ncbi:DUF192 domain-containing protein [Curtanaerobium respiraculi]|uniref:DUF192 domain-containing protein n=1 Tax=Curtanaerobium respiraculi TaxID=2949669 RepID=UPI0024B3BC36|nr:DUF192 domain-containing protein [Curtanaerobium respiraculi]
MEEPYCTPARWAVTWRSRLRGLLRRPAAEGALVLAPCRGIHTYGMGCPIDVAFIDGAGRVLKAERSVVPGRVLRCKGAAVAIERAADESRRWPQVGERVGLSLG